MDGTQSHCPMLLDQVGGNRPTERGWNWVGFKALSNLSHSMILTQPLQAALSLPEDNSPAALTRRADEVLASPPHPGEPPSHPMPQPLSSDSSCISLTFFIWRRSVWNWKELPAHPAEESCHSQQLGFFRKATEHHSSAGGTAQSFSCSQRNIPIPIPPCRAL